MRKREAKIVIFHPPGHFSNDHSSHGWGQAGARNLGVPSSSPMWVARAQLLGPCCAAFPRYMAVEPVQLKPLPIGHTGTEGNGLNSYATIQS